MRKDWSEGHDSKMANDELRPPVESFLKRVRIMDARKIQAPGWPLTRAIGL